MADKIILKGFPNQLKPLITHIIAVREIIEQKDIGTIYEAPEQKILERRSDKPEIILAFRQDSDFVKGGNQPGYTGRNRTKGRISFRIMNENANSISKAELTNIGTKIKQIFGANNGYLWEKGKELYSYTDWAKGYQFQLLCKNKAVAKDITTKALAIQGHTPDWKFLNEVENDTPFERYPENPGNQVILGETVQLPKVRPLVEVRFQYAVASIKGLTKPVTLYDRRFKRAKALVI